MDRDFSKVIQKDIFSKGVGFPKALSGQSWRSFIKVSIFISLIIYGIVTLASKFLFLPYSLVHTIKLFCIGFFAFGLLGYLNNLRLRAKFFEREKIANDRRAEKLRKHFLQKFAVNKVFSNKQKSSSNDKNNPTEEDKRIEKLKSRINNVEVLVNTRQSLSHSIYRHYTILIHCMTDEYDQRFLNGLLVNGTLSSVDSKEINKKSSSYVSTSAETAFYASFKYRFVFSTIKRLNNGDLYIEAVENLGADPYYYAKRITALENWKTTSEMTHSVPYLPTTAFGVAFSGFVNHTAKNEENKVKAQNWLNENMDEIQKILAENDIEAVFIPSSVSFRQSTVELDFTISSDRKASNNQKYMDVAGVIDSSLDLKGSMLSATTDNIHLSLSLPNGKRPNGEDRKNDNGEIENFTQVLNLEDVFRELYG